MAKIIFITGGQRSGKSRHAQKIALSCSSQPVYLATARAWDDDFAERIKRHKADRGSQWRNIEKDKFISQLNFQVNDVVVLDCITLWLTNIFHDNDYDVETSLTEACEEWDKLSQQDFTLIVVTNELGMSLHSENESGRKFTDLQGWMNQYIASNAFEVFMMIAGIAVKIK